MTNSKWLRSALLGGVAVSVMAVGIAGAQAQTNELSDLKAQLEALQSRVNTIETAPTLPAGTSAITVRRGVSTDKRLMEMGVAASEMTAPAGRGFTFAVTPAADLPAPVTEVTVTGFIRSRLQWNDENVRIFRIQDAVDGTPSRWDIDVDARFRIRARTDTAIGQIRTLIEVQGSEGGAVAVRHALGEWDMTPNWTFQMGRTWATATPLDYGVTLVGSSWQAGPDVGRTQMVRMRYTNGPIRVMFALENPSFSSTALGTTADYPNIAAQFRYTASGGSQFWLAGEIADMDFPGNSNTGYLLNGGANIALGDIATLTTTATYGKGIAARNFGNINFGALNAAGNPTKALGAGVGVSFTVSEATTINAQYGYARLYQQAGALTRNVHSIHANVLWRPVQQMRLGWEVRWGKEKQANNASNDVLGAAFGAWFFF